jgi:glycosyltransferase involved in cell wall biosynthesis
LDIALCSPVSLSYWGGAEKKLCEIGTLLMDRGHDVRIYALPYEYEGRKVDPLLHLGDIPYTERWGTRIQADVSYVYYQPMVWRLMNIRGPKIAGLHSAGLIECITPYVYLTYKFFGKYDLQSFKTIHVVNKIFNINHSNVEYVPNWIDLDIYKPSREKLSKFTLLYVGRKRKEKGWPIFLKLCKYFDRKGYDFKYLCTGEGEGPIRGLSYISDANQLAEIYSSAHVVIYPSEVDTFGLVIVESLACGTPVITTTIQSHKYLNLPLIYADDLSEYAKSVLSVFNTWKNKNAYYQNLVNKGLKIVKKYDKNELFPKLENMLIKTAEKR